MDNTITVTPQEDCVNAAEPKNQSEMEIGCVLDEPGNLNLHIADSHIRMGNTGTLTPQEDCVNAAEPQKQSEMEIVDQFIKIDNTIAVTPQEDCVNAAEPQKQSEMEIGDQVIKIDNTIAVTSQEDCVNAAEPQNQSEVEIGYVLDDYGNPNLTAQNDCTDAAGPQNQSEMEIECVLNDHGNPNLTPQNDCVNAAGPQNQSEVEIEYLLDDYGNPNLHRAHSQEPRPLANQHDKIIAKYRWRGPSVFSEAEDSGSSDSDEDFNEEFNKIMAASKLCSINEEEEITENKTQENHHHRSFPKLDKNMYCIPDLSELTLTCMESLKFEPFGIAVQHYDSLVLIKAHDGLRFLDMDTMLFRENGQSIGKIYELMGLLESPFYNILYPNSKIAEETLPLGTEVFYAPEAPENITRYLDLANLERRRFLEEEKDGSGGEDDDLEDDADDAEKAYYFKLKQELKEYEKRMKQKRSRQSSVSSTSSLAPRKKRNPNNQYGTPAVPRSYRRPQENAFALPQGSYSMIPPPWFHYPGPPSEHQQGPYSNFPPYPPQGN